MPPIYNQILSSVSAAIDSAKLERVYFQKQCTPEWQVTTLLFITKARLGGEETGGHSALFIYLLQLSVGRMAGLVEAGR